MRIAVLFAFLFTVGCGSSKTGGGGSGTPETPREPSATIAANRTIRSGRIAPPPPLTNAQIAENSEWERNARAKLTEGIELLKDKKSWIEATRLIGIAGLTNPPHQQETKEQLLLIHEAMIRLEAIADVTEDDDAKDRYGLRQFNYQSEIQMINGVADGNTGGQTRRKYFEQMEVIDGDTRTRMGFAKRPSPY